MSNRVFHHRCRCLDKNFTVEEYSDWLKNHDDGAVFTFGEFGFNLYDVCLTPHTPIDISIKKDRFKIETAQSPNGRWSYGISYYTEKEAVFAGLKVVEKGTRRELYNIPDCEYDEAKDKYISTAVKASLLRQVLEKIERLKEIYNPQQLSLFDL